MTPEDCLQGCSCLTSVSLSGNYYTSVPVFLSAATTLQCLHIANNSISSGTTSCLAALTALTKLVMQQCALETIPDSFAALSNLQWLCLSRNNVGSIPDGLPWSKLALLHLRGNQLRAVPCSALAGATQLQVVDCGENIPLQVSHIVLRYCAFHNKKHAFFPHMLSLHESPSPQTLKFLLSICYLHGSRVVAIP